MKALQLLRYRRLRPHKYGVQYATPNTEMKTDAKNG